MKDDGDTGRTEAVNDSDQQDSAERTQRSDFETAGDDAPLSLTAELFLFLKEEKKWWLTPIVVVLLVVGVVVALASTGAAPFIYTLF